MSPPANGAVIVVKIGGGLAALPRALDNVCSAVGQAAGQRRLVVVPGGGPFADAVRELDRRVGLSPDAAHWMAILGMDQYAHVLAGRIPGAVLVEEPGAIAVALAHSGVAVLAPSRWMRSADVLPHTWDVTSDSVAAFVAGALDAARLVLIKPATELSDPVDPYFTTALPAGMSYSIVGADRIEEISRRLSE
jgi:5-(aminomethyl)-3-furanmethanol phosphate kinase